MNLYIRTLGFDNMTSEAEAKFIKTGIRESIKEGFVIRHEKLDRGVIILRLSNSTGLYVYGRYEKNVFKYEYYFPFVVGKALSDNEEMTIERHLDKESYAVICDELKTGVTLIFYLQNVMDYLDYLYSGKDFNADDFNPDRKNEIGKVPIRNKKVALTGLSLGGIIMLPVRKERNSKKSRQDEIARKNLIQAAKNGDEDAIESLTIEDIDMVDNSGGLSATIELYRTKERQVSLEKENEQLEKLMNTDDLTQVFNRRCFNNDIINQTLQNKSSVAVAMIDIDYFKQYNDIYGHQMGDQALIEVGKCMNKYNREGIVRFYRYGGDEFTVIFIDQSEENVCEIMDSLINDIKFKEIPHKGSKTDCILTLSYGYAICTGQKIDIQALIKQADEQLYQHKKLRRLVTLNKK